MGIHIDTCAPQKYPPDFIALLEQIFEGYAVASVTKHFTQGQSGTFVFWVESKRQNSENEAPVQWRLGAAYDRVPPVNLLLKFRETIPVPTLLLDATNDPVSYPQCQPSDWVQLHKFVITEIDVTERTLTLNLPWPDGIHTSAYCLCIRYSELLSYLIAARFLELQLSPTAIHNLYQWLDHVAQHALNAAGFFSIPQPLLQTMPQLQSTFIALTTIRNHVREYLAVRKQWCDYFVALVLILLSSLKFTTLDYATAGMNPKAVAFEGAATLFVQLEQSVNLMHID